MASQKHTEGIPIKCKPPEYQFAQPSGSNHCGHSRAASVEAEGPTYRKQSWRQRHLGGQQNAPRILPDCRRHLDHQCCLIGIDTSQYKITEGHGRINLVDTLSATKQNISRRQHPAALMAAFSPSRKSWMRCITTVEFCL